MAFHLTPKLWKFQLRFGKVNKYISNTNVFEHSGKFYSIAENHIPQEIDILTLKTLGNWDAPGGWNRPFTSHPKVHYCRKLINLLFLGLHFFSVDLKFSKYNDILCYRDLLAPESWL